MHCALLLALWAASMLRGDASYELCDFATLVRLVRVVAWLDLDGLLDEWRREVATSVILKSARPGPFRFTNRLTRLGS